MQARKSNSSNRYFSHVHCVTARIVATTQNLMSADTRFWDLLSSWFVNDDLQTVFKNPVLGRAYVLGLMQVSDFHARCH